jgi:hypothetical protein
MPQVINTNTTLTQVQIAAQKAKIVATYQALVDGINAQLGDTATFLIGGKSYAKSDLVGPFQARIDAAKKTVAEANHAPRDGGCRARAGQGGSRAARRLRPHAVGGSSCSHVKHSTRSATPLSTRNVKGLDDPRLEMRMRRRTRLRSSSSCATRG